MSGCELGQNGLMASALDVAHRGGKGKGIGKAHVIF